VSTQTLLPNASSSASSAFTVTGAGSVHAALNDTSDSSYVKRAASTYAEATSWLVVSCSNYTIPAGSIVRRVRTRVKVLVPSGGALGFGLADADTWRFKASKTIAPTGSAVWVSGPWETTPAGGGSWTQERLDAASVALRDYAWDSSGYVATIYEAKLEVEVVAAPTLSVTAPTGSQSSPSPTCTWTYTGTDGYQQAAYIVKVFDSATYGGGGFNPDTSTPVWETAGYGTATSIPLGPLPTAPTQRAYVKVQASSGLWSAWAYSGFTYSVDGPTTPAVFASWLDSMQYVLLSVRGRLNELTANTASMESGIGTWVADSSGTTTVSAGPTTSLFFGGSVGVQAGRYDAAGAGTCRIKSGTVGAAAANDYRSARADLRSYSGNRSCRVGIRWIGPGTITWGTAVTANTSTWTTAVVEYALAPSGTTGWEMVIEFTSTAANEIMFFDKCAAHVNNPAAWGAGGYSLGTQQYVLERSQDGGVTWMEIASGALNGVQTVAVADRTAKREVDAIYRARTTADLSGYAVPSEVSATATVTTTSDGQVWLRTADGSIDLPGVRLFREMGDERPRNLNVFDPIPEGREVAYPIVVEGDLPAQRGRWRIQAHDQAEVDVLEPVLKEGQKLLALLPYGEQWWIRITNVARNSTGSPRFTEYDVAWVEVEA